MKKFFLCALLICFSFCSAQSKVFYWEGEKNSKKVALSFDDGPGETTSKILEILEAKNVKATFFMSGKMSQKNPLTTRKVVEKGHEIANHTYGHINFYQYKEDDKNQKIEDELLKSEKIIENNSGIKPFLVRFPNGYSRDDAIDIAKKHGYYVINWSFGCDWDTKLTEEEAYQRYLKALRNGAIFLMHDSPSSKILKHLPDFIDKIKDEGYEIVTVGELLGFIRILEKEN